MAIHKWSEKKIAELMKAGRGQGTGADYKPWITTRDFSSVGNAERLLSRKTGRRHELLSSLEYAFCTRAEWSQDVVDIQEQYPLDRDLTRSLANELRIKHPCYPATHVPFVMTTDFLLTLNKDGEVSQLAVDVKTAADVRSLWTIEKLEIARAYFQELGIKHHVVLDSHLSKDVTRNLNWLYMGRRHVGAEDQARSDHMKQEMLNWLQQLDAQEQRMTVGGLVERFDELAGQRGGTSLAVMRDLMYERIVPFDLYGPEPSRVRWTHLLSLQQHEPLLPEPAQA